VGLKPDTDVNPQSTVILNRKLLYLGSAMSDTGNGIIKKPEAVAKGDEVVKKAHEHPYTWRKFVMLDLFSESQIMAAQFVKTGWVVHGIGDAFLNITFDDIVEVPDFVWVSLPDASSRYNFSGKKIPFDCYTMNALKFP
jgi:hypothetical protein